MSTLISRDNTLALWFIIIGFVCFAMWAEKRFKWARAMGVALICVVGGMIMPTINLVPTSAGVYDAIWDIVVPVAIPLVLFDANLFKIGKQCGRLLIIFMLACVGTMAGAVVASCIFRNNIPELHAVAATYVGSQTGGSMNLVAASQMFNMSEEIFDAVYLADTLSFSFTLFTLTTIPMLKVFQKFWGQKYARYEAISDEEVAAITASAGQASSMSTFDVAKGLALSFGIVAASTFFANWVSSVSSNAIITQLFGQKYLVITFLSVILATAFPKQVGNIRGSQKLGMFLMFIFFVAISIGADLKLIVTIGPALLIFSFIVFSGIVIFSLVGGKIFKFSIEEICVAANAALGGPSTAAAQAAASGWRELVTPAVLMGVFGYILGTYFAAFTGNLVFSMFGI